VANSLENFDTLVNPQKDAVYLILSRSASGKGTPLTFEQARLVLATDSLAELGIFIPEDVVLVEIEDRAIAEYIVSKNFNLFIYRINEKYYFLARDGKWRSTINNTLACGIKASTYGGGKTAPAQLIPFISDDYGGEALTDFEVLNFPSILGALPPLLKPLNKISKDNPITDYNYPLVTSIENSLLTIHKNLSILGYNAGEKNELVLEVNEKLTTNPLTQDEIDGFLTKNMLKQEVSEFFTAKGEFLHNKMGDYLIASLNLKRDGVSKMVYYWDEKAKLYKSNDEVIKLEATKLFPLIKEYQREEVMNYIRLVLSVDSVRFNSNPFTVVFKNGIMDVLNDKEFKDMTPSDLETIQINCNYNPKARITAEVEEFFRTASVRDSDVETLLYEAIGYAMLKTNELQKVFLLIGEGRNGKSTYLDIVREVLGHENVTNVSFKDLSGSFRVASLDNKLASVTGDISTQPLQDSDLFKAISGGDSVMLEKKFKDAYEKSLFATMFFAANKLPRTPDTSEGFYRRFTIIPFQADLTGVSRVDGLKFKRALLSKESIEYIAKRSIEAIYKVLTETMDFTIPSRVARALEEYKIQNSSTLSWFYDVHKGEVSKILGKNVTALYNDYKGWCSVNNFGIHRSSNFEDQLRTHCKIRIDMFNKFAVRAEQTIMDLQMETEDKTLF
jgi:P4 family phage/plasmid primase-like protien